MKPRIIAAMLFMVVLVSAIFLNVGQAGVQEFSGLNFAMVQDRGNAFRSLRFSFDGYTNHWIKEAWHWQSARGLFLRSQTTLESEIWALEAEIGKQLLLDEPWIEPGFVKELAKHTVINLEVPAAEQLASAISSHDVLVMLTDQNPVAKVLVGKLPEELQFRRNRAFLLRSGDRTVFVLASHSQDELHRLRMHIDQAVSVVQTYDLYRGIAGVNTNFLAISPDKRINPFVLINTALKLGCSWVMVSGYNDWMLPGPVNEALNEIGFPFLFISGQSVEGGVLYGLDRYPDIQDNTLEGSLDWAKRNGGYYFADLSRFAGKRASLYDGYMMQQPSDQRRILELDTPFVTQAVEIGSEVPATMVTLLEKGTALTQSSIMDAIGAKRAVAVYEKGVLAGPPKLRDALRILMLERIFLEEALEGSIDIDAAIEGRSLKVKVRNLGEEPVAGTLRFQTAPTVTLSPGNASKRVALGPHEIHTLTLPLQLTPEASGRDNLVGLVFSGNGTERRALTHVDLPNAVELHPLLFDVPGTFEYPITLWNYTDQQHIRLQVSITRAENGESAFAMARRFAIPPEKGSGSRSRLPSRREITWPRRRLWE